MRSMRLIKLAGVVAGTGVAAYAASKVKIESNGTERGVIEHVMTDKNQDGDFVNQNHLSLQHVSSQYLYSGVDVYMDLQRPFLMDLANNPVLIKKAQDACEKKNIVKVQYDQYLAANFFTGKPSRVVLNIEEVDLEQERNLESSYFKNRS